MASIDIPIPLVGPSNPGLHPSADSQRSINLYPVRIEREGEKARWHLVGTPGLALFCTLAAAPIRGLHVLRGRLFAVAGPQLIEIYPDATTRLWGAIGSVRGRVSMAELGDELVIGDGTGFSAFSLATGQITAIAAAPIGRHCVAFNQRLLYVERGSGRVYYSEPLDAAAIPALNFFTAENRPDDLLTAVATEDQVWLFGQDTIEIWYDSGDADAPFQRIAGGVVHAGLLAEDSALRADNSLFWVEKDGQGRGIVRRSQGFTPIRVSTAAVERFTAGASALAAYTYQEQGHIFYVLNAPPDRGPGQAGSGTGGTWVYDVKEQEWHERAWVNPASGEFERARPELHAFAYGRHLVADHSDGRVYEQSLSLYDDAGTPLVARRITPHAGAEGRAMTVDELWVDLAAGTGLATGQGAAPKAMLRYSTDGGRNWSNELHRPLGRIGETSARARWHSLGLGRDWVFELSLSDPVPRVLLGARAKVRVGRR